MSDLIYEKAKIILIEKRKQERINFHKQKRDNRIIEAGLCPCCGENLLIIDSSSARNLHVLNHSTYEILQKRIEQYLKKHKLIKPYDYVEKLEACSINPKHYFKTEGHFFSDDD